MFYRHHFIEEPEQAGYVYGVVIEIIWLEGYYYYKAFIPRHSSGLMLGLQLGSVLRLRLIFLGTQSRC